MVIVIVSNARTNFYLMFSLRKVFSNARQLLPNVRAMSAKGPLTELTVDDDGIATLTMQRLPVNSLNLELLQELTKNLDEVAKNESKGLIITSASSTVFSAGLDITEMHKPDIKRMEAFWSALQGFWLKLYGAPYPTSAAINGHAPAGGCLIAMSCEHRVMVSGKFRIGLNETALGIVAPRWFMDTMLGVVPPRTAEFALTSGRMFTVEEAAKEGLIDETATDKADALAKSKKFIEKFDEIPPLARAFTKQQFRGPALEALKNNLAADLKQFSTFATSPQVQQGLEMYLMMMKQKSAK